MKRTLFALLALAFCLTACTPATTEPESGSEVSQTTVENAATAEESAPSAAPVAGGAIWGENCQADSGRAWYTVNPLGDENGIRQVQLLRLDYNTGKEVLKLLQDQSREQGMTVVIITHNSALTAMADRVIRVRSGTISSVKKNDHVIPVEEIEW